MPTDTKNLYQHKSGIWWVRIRVQGVEYRRSTKTRNRREAEAKARRIVAELVAEPPRRQLEPLSIESLMISDVADVENRGTTPKHVRALESQWVVIARTLGRDFVVSDLSVERLRAYEGQRRKQGVRGQTIRRETALLKRAVRRACDQGLVDETWANRLERKWPKVRADPADEKRSGKLWPPELLRRYLHELHEEARAEAAFVMMTGLRSKEAKRVEPGWIESTPDLPTPALLRMPPAATKTRRARDIPLPEPCLLLVQWQLMKAPSRRYVLSQSDYKKHRERVSKQVLGLECTITLRDLRHSYASYALRGSADPTAVMRILGHTDLKMTERYLSAPLTDMALAGRSVAGLLLDAKVGSGGGYTHGGENV